MYIGLERFKQPDDNDILWRYMSFKRFEEILENKTLFFAKASVYQRDDPYEGKFNKKSKEKYIESMLSGLPGTTYDNSTDQVKQHLNNRVLERDNFNKHFSNELLINCWHINNYESAAMWKLYSNYKDGIAITTTFANLKLAFRESSHKIIGSRITYIDVNNDLIDYGSTHEPFMHKRKSFEHEKEFRITTELNCSGIQTASNNSNQNYYKINCSIDTLINDIYLSPINSKNFKKKVERVIDGNGFKFNILMSDILSVN